MDSQLLLVMIQKHVTNVTCSEPGYVGTLFNARVFTIAHVVFCPTTPVPRVHLFSWKLVTVSHSHCTHHSTNNFLLPTSGNQRGNPASCYSTFHSTSITRAHCQVIRFESQVPSIIYFCIEMRFMAVSPNGPAINKIWRECFDHAVLVRGFVDPV